MRNLTGRVNIFIMHSPNFFGPLHPCHDSAPDAIGELTEKEVSTLRGMVARYITLCHKKHGCAELDASIKRGE